MEIKIVKELSKEQEAFVRRLHARCNQEDGTDGKLFLSTELNFDKEIPAFYLGYKEGNLVSFLMLFMPESHEAEITAYTHPEYRRHGYFTMLYREAERICEGFGIHTFLLTVDEKNKSGKAAAEAVSGAEFSFSEYKMEWSRKCVPEIRMDEETNFPDKVQFEEVNVKNQNIYRSIVKPVLETVEECEEFLNAVLEGNGRRAYIEYSEGIPIGLFHLACEEGETCIYGVGILPEYRGKGLGNVMLIYALAKAKKFGEKVVLEVNSENHRAFHLYCKYGFQIIQQTNYYKVLKMPLDRKNIP